MKNLSDVRLKLCLIFKKKFKVAAILSSQQTLFTESYTGSWIYQNNSHEIFRHFELFIDSLTQILTEICQFKKNWPILLPGDVINDVMKHMYIIVFHKLLILMHRKFNDHIFARFFIIMKNAVISFIKIYRRPTLRPSYDVIDDVLMTFFWHNLGQSFHIWGKIETVFDISNFQYGRHFELGHFFSTRSITGSWIYQKDSQEHFRYFELMIDAVAQMLTEIYHFQNVTYFVILWRDQRRHECVKYNLHN